jgi:predicted nucleic acid-binding protein
MSSTLVLDANIIIRAVLGKKVREHLLEFSEIVDFFTPDICVEEVKEHLPTIFKKRGISSELPLQVFSHIQSLLQVIDSNLYQERIHEAKQRMKGRDLDDWPVVATALLFNCPIWTEDKDFFGVGIPVWTTDRIHIFFDSLKEADF